MAISFAHTHVGKRPPFSYSLPWPLHKNCLPYPLVTSAFLHLLLRTFAFLAPYNHAVHFLCTCYKSTICPPLFTKRFILAVSSLATDHKSPFLLCFLLTPYALPSKRKNHDKYRVLERCCEIFAMVIQYFYHQNEWFRLHLRPKDLYCDHAM